MIRRKECLCKRCEASHTVASVAGTAEYMLKADDKGIRGIRNRAEEGGSKSLLLYDIAMICWEAYQEGNFLDSKTHWEKPHARGRLQPKIRRAMLTILRSINIRFEGGGEENDPLPLSEQEKRANMLRARTICDGRCDRGVSLEGLWKSDVASIICKKCTNLVRREETVQQSLTCPCCLGERTQGEDPSTDPCRVCESVWTLHNRGMIVREMEERERWETDKDQRD
jgi:hypothetical protein